MIELQPPFLKKATKRYKNYQMKRFPLQKKEPKRFDEASLIPYSERLRRED